MQPLAIHAHRVLTPFEEIADAVVVVQRGKITDVVRGPNVDLPAGDPRNQRRSGKTVVPGLCRCPHSRRGRPRRDGRHARGTGNNCGDSRQLSAPLPLWPPRSPPARVETCDSVRASRTLFSIPASIPPANLSAEILGIHFEGPFITAPRGAECIRRNGFCRPPRRCSTQFLEEARGTAQILTLAPELPGALELIAAARKAGLVVSLGHTDATYEQAQAAIEAGATHAAHVFNAMRPFSHRGTGVIGAVLTSPQGEHGIDRRKEFTSTRRPCACSSS